MVGLDLAKHVLQVLGGIVAEPGVEAGLPLTPLISGHAFDLCGAECVEAVHQCHTDVDFGRLPIPVS